MKLVRKSHQPRFVFPPTSFNRWQDLDTSSRLLWLRYASKRFFSGVEFFPSKRTGRVVVVDGMLIDNLLGFYCAIGEAVNGPGGYFGLSMQAFDDCLFSGFGLEYPYTIVFKDAERMRTVLDARSVLDYLDREVSFDLPSDAESFAEGIAWCEQTRKAALAGEQTLFDLIVDAIRSVPERGGGAVNLVLE